METVGELCVPADTVREHGVMRPVLSPSALGQELVPHLHATTATATATPCQGLPGEDRLPAGVSPVSADPLLLQGGRPLTGKPLDPPREPSLLEEADVQRKQYE